MAKFITQLRHGTTSDWQKTSVIPAKNELVIEYRDDGSKRFKLGDGATHFRNLDYIDGDLERTLDVINARVSNLIVPPSGQISCDDEVEDIRVGYDGTTFDRAGDAVRAIGEDTYNLRKSLQQFINGDAVDGLLYEDNLLYLTADGVIVSDPVEIKGGSGGGSGDTSSSKVKITNNNGTSTISAASGSPVVLQFTFTSLEDEIPTGDFTCSISVAGKVVRSVSLAQGAHSINVAEYLEAGTNTVRVTCTDIYGNARSLAYTCTVIDLSIVSSFNSSIPFDADINFKYTPMGDIEKVVHFIVDGKEIASHTITSSGRQTTQIIPLMSHGGHTLDVYMTAVLNDQTITSNHLVYDIMCIQAGRTEPLISSVFTTKETKQGEILSIPYVVYDPSKTEADINLIITQMVNGVETACGHPTPLTVDRTQQYWNVRNYPVGTVRFTISYVTATHNVSKTHEVLVEPSDLSVEPITDSLVLHLSSVGRSNNEADPGKWNYNDVTTTFSDFNWESNGWVVDSDKDTCLRLNGDARIDIGYQLFGRDFREMGKTIELEFAIRDVNDRDAVVVDCTDGEVSLQVTADTATLSGSGAKVNCTYRENERVRIGFTVGMSTNGTRFVSTYVDGILSNITQYPTTGNFEQKNKKTISIGSSLCGIDLYTIRVYDNELSPNEMVQNFIADATIPSVKQELFEDNDIYNSNGKVSYEKIKSKIPVITFVGAMPTYKGDKKKNSVRMIFEHPTHPELNFDEILKEIDVQGTSSQFYVRKNWKTKHNDYHQHMTDQVPAKVFCMKVDYAEATGTHNTQVANFAETLYTEKIPPQAEDPRVRTTIAGFPCVIFEKETEESDPVFSSKANFNFDKGAENAFGFTDKYTTECWEFCNNTSDSCNFLGEVPADWKDDFEPRYIGEKTKVLNSDGEEEEVNIWDRIEELREKKEALAALSPPQELTPADAEELATLNGLAIDRFKVMHDWVVSTATVVPDGNGGVVPITPKPLDTPVTYGGVTYTEDNRAYRLAKFTAEFEQYFNMHYSAIYYVFTFFALMTDQRAKNMFLTYWENNGKGRWYPYLYDNDTSFGINNEGARVFDYYHEDTDKLGTSNVYNGQNSVLWSNFRECFPLQIREVYKNLRSDKKITYDELVRRFITEGSEQWSASLYNEDAEFKYITMARPELVGEENVDTANLYQVKGSAEHHFKYFVENRLMYCDSKWNCGDYPSDYAFLRIYTPQLTGGNTPTYTSTVDDSGTITITSNWLIDGVDTGLPVNTDAEGSIIAPIVGENGNWYINNTDTGIKATGKELVVPADPRITVTPFSHMYVGLKYKANGTFQSKRRNAGESWQFSPPGYDDGKREIFNDTETGIYGASELSSLGDLSGLYCGVINVSACKKLTDLIIGNHTEGYSNDMFRELSIGSNKLLTKLDVTNCTGLGLDHGNGTPQETLSVKNCPNIEEVYAHGTNIKTIELPESGYLRVLHAPATLTSLTIKNQLYLEDANLQIPDWKNIKQLYLDNCPKLDTVSILNRCKDEDGNWTVEWVRLTNVHWDLDNVEFLRSLYNVRGRDQNEANTDHAYLIGTCHIKELTGEEMAEINAAYPYLDITFDKLDAKLTFLDLDGNLIVADGFANPQEIHAVDNIGGTGTCPIQSGKYAKPVRAADAQYTYEWGGWSRFQDEEPEADALTNIRADRTVYLAFKKTVRKYDVEFYNDNYLLATVNTPYGSTAIYPGSDPQKLETDHPELYEFRGWDPSPEYVTGPLKVYAQFFIDDDNWYILGLNDIEYKLNSTNKTLSIVSCNSPETLVKIPETFSAAGDTYTVVSVDGFNSLDVELVDVPSSLQVYEDAAFKDCTALSHVEVPENVSRIGLNAFANCTNLDTVEYNAVSATADVSNSVRGPFDGCVSEKGFTATIGSNVISIPDSLFAQATVKENTLTHVTFDEGSKCSNIGSYAFSCTSLRSLDLPSSIRTISNHAFKENNYITELSLPEGVKTIGQNAFSGWKKLKSFTIPSTVTSIGTGVFSDCYNLEEIVVEDGNTIYEVVDNCLIEKSKNSLVQGCMTSNIPSHVTEIQASAFEGMTQLTEISIPSGVETISASTFSDCTNLTNVAFEGNTVKNIHMLAFYNCKKLNNITLPSQLETVESTAFGYNEALTSIVFPASMHSVGDYVFRYCENLESITFNGTPSQISATAFQDCASLTEINVPWAEGAVANAPWGATNATINYNQTGE